MSAFAAAAGVVAVLIAGVLGYAATRPDSFRVERAARIQAPPEKIYPHIADFERWSAWSPWEKRDPAMKRTFGAVASGKGAVYEWDGNREVGKGRMEITDVTPPAKVVIKLDFISPFEGHNVAEFTLAAKDGATDVRWVMHGPATYVTKLMGLFMNMDTMIGRDFEAGLASLKAVAEK